MPTVTSVLLSCPLIAFVWSGCTCRPYCATQNPCQTEADSFCPSVRRGLSCHDVNLFSPYTQSMHSTVPSQIASFGRSIIPAGRTSQKRFEQGPKIDLFPSPHHQTTPPFTSYLWPMAPTMSYIGWVQAGGAWALRMLPSQICPRGCLLLMCLP